MDSRQRTFSVKKFLCLAMVCLAASLSAQTTNLFINNSPLISPPAIAPQINARAWLNLALFDVTSLNSFNFPVPYESQNTLFFTNAPLTPMHGDPGYRWFQNTNGQRLWMDTWENQGSIRTDHNTFLSTFGLFINDSRASILQVAAANITSTGPLSSGEHGLIRLEGKNITLSHNTLRTGTPEFLPGTIVGGGFVFLGSSNYVNDVGVSDLYWGVGIGNAVANNRASAMPVVGPNFSLPSPSSPFHEVITPSTFGFFFTNTTTIPGSFFFFLGTNFFSGFSFFGGYTAVVNTNSLNPTSSIIQVVYYPTNNADSNFVTDVRFGNFFGGPVIGPATVVVGFHSIDFDIATQTSITNSVFLTDGLATTTNVFLARNLGANTRRP